MRLICNIVRDCNAPESVQFILAKNEGYRIRFYFSMNHNISEGGSINFG